MDVFDLRRRLVGDYEQYIRSFISIQDERIREEVDQNLDGGLLWPEPRIGLNPSFAPGGWVDELVAGGLLHDECSRIFRVKKEDGSSKGLRLHKHQVDAIRAARSGENYVLTTGTGSGKSLSYIVPIVDKVLRNGSSKGIKAIVVYPMNALANSQEGELRKFLELGYPPGHPPVRFEKYTGQESDEERQAIIANPPDILLTNYVMLELILTRVEERQLVAAAKGLEFLVFDELHTYRGRQGADVALLARRVREACRAEKLQVVGTSATMASGGAFAEQQREVARTASLLFGAPVQPNHVIGETLQRSTAGFDPTDPAQVAALREALLSGDEPPTDLAAFVAHPLSCWIESMFGIGVEDGSGRLVRQTPRRVREPEGAARELADLTGRPFAECADLIEAHLMAGNAVLQESGFPVFAFRLHQFISRGDTVYASLGRPDDRYVTVNPQRFVPGDRDKMLLPLVFCRECGQEYYSVSVDDHGGRTIDERPFGLGTERNGAPAYLYVSDTRPWPDDDSAAICERVPEMWVEEASNGEQRIKRDYRKRLPERVSVTGSGVLNAGGISAWLVPAPFRFCLGCGVAYGSRQNSDLPKLATLGSGGRSTATTILSAATVRYLLTDPSIEDHERKLLAFTDNRQDASLQAGHFNDFVEVGLLRSALYRAVELGGTEGVRHDVLTQAVFDALGLPKELYAQNPNLKGLAALETDKALRDVLGYRLYIDLKRGWRITSPNLEQTGLLRIDYATLSEAAADESLWSGLHGALASASPKQREDVARTLLDHLRRELAIKVDYLDARRQEQIVRNSEQWLTGAWALDEDEKLEHGFVCFPRSRVNDDGRDSVYVSSRGGFGQYLRRNSTFPGWVHRLKTVDTDDLIPQLMAALNDYGLLSVVLPAKGDESPAGYQLNAAALVWRQGEGRVLPDPIRVPRPPEVGLRPNRFFVDFYQSVAANGQGLEAREHTAQVPMEKRLEREDRFRKATLPVLYCSPTMALGVDIAGLLVVGLRNVPPTPANYAQRSGRAGRSGQPALVFTYCTVGSPHDQFFFRRQERMVAGSVTPPRIDLANEDLVRAHVQAVWLAETGLSLGASLTDVLDVLGDDPTLEFVSHVVADIERETPRKAAAERARRVLADIAPDLERSSWWHDGWVDEAMHTVGSRFRRATERWCQLYRSALEQTKLQQRIVNDASRSPKDREQAKRLRREAESQLELLRSESSRLSQSDFYSYRYFASEGFLPGYSFPRLPLSAFIPGRRGAKGADEFLSRPRFLAIREFGPRNFVYHEGSRYQINRVILPVPEVGTSEDERVLTRSVKVCNACGYLHPLDGGKLVDECDSCRQPLPAPLDRMFRLQNVVTRRRDRINSDEEERQRQGYELQTGVRFGPEGPVTARAVFGSDAVAELAYGHVTTIWRINLGWTRRNPTEPPGFILDLERGYWAKRQESNGDDDGADDPLSARQARVVPYVDDTRNVVVIDPAGLPADEGARKRIMASLEAALKTALQVTFQLEDAELAAESLPSPDDRRRLLLYESAEGGAGVLRRLVEDPKALAVVARAALEICHFNPETGGDLGHAPGAIERCEAACYDCLLSYGNQPDHRVVDRFLVKEILQTWAQSAVAASPGKAARPGHLSGLLAQCSSDLERRFLHHLDAGGFRLPSRAQVLVTDAGTRPDFSYDDAFVVVYVDGLPHDFPDRQARDDAQQRGMEDLGWTVLRFRHDEQWDELIRARKDVFGEGGR